jgi:betaine reductase
MTSVARTVGAPRIVAAGRIPHPVGDPTRAPAAERVWRERVLTTALRALETPVAGEQVFEAR